MVDDCGQTYGCGDL